MGLFDSFMPGETGGMPDTTSQSGWQGLLNGGNPLLNIGLGILANNHGNYGSFGAAIGKGTQQGIQNNQQYNELMQQKQLQALRMKQYQYEMGKQTKQDASDQAYGDSFNAAVQQPTNIANQSFQDANNNAMQGSDALPMQGSVGDNLSPVDSSQPYSTSQTSAGGFDKSAFLQAVMSNPNVSADKKMAVMQAMQKEQSKFSTTPQYDQNGNAFVLDDLGNMKSLSGVKSRDELVATDLGGKIGFRTKYEPNITSTVTKSVTPDSALSNSTTLRGQNMVDARAKNTSDSQSAKLDPLGLNKPQQSISKTASLQDIADTAKASGKSTAQVTADLKSKGYIIGGK